MATEIRSVILQKQRNRKKIQNHKLGFILLGNLSHKNKQILDAVSQIPDVKTVPANSMRYGIFFIENNSK